ncbi:hypothetical protein JZM24_09120 [Candidatus Sodalis endolongispinus]|uniref:Uncharacterized protein n=1 Tax=Candidatus Sodalis endolongispinus TaxID=2812662 RepID=A0ABS5YBA4_9GAMM|nr:hypothetical protein [Candidatus Sodalis endolongispinus]MBT9432244.1 hypothetical protein [Candidatus Sodalis endolongispinus]
MKKNNRFRVGYIWPAKNTEVERIVTLYIKRSYFDKDIKVALPAGQSFNNPESYITLSLLEYVDDGQWFGTFSICDKEVDSSNFDKTWDTNITLYDEYGNKVFFHVTQNSDIENEENNGNQIVLHEGHL